VNQTGEDREDLELLAKSAKEQLSFEGNATIGSLNLTTDILSDILGPMNGALLEIVKSFRTPDSVEFVGGASRLPLLRSAVAAFFTDSPVLTSLNPEEAATFGAIYYEAIQSKLFYGQKIQLNKTSASGFTVKKGEKSREMLAPGSQLTLRMISFLESDDFSFSLLADASEFLTIDVSLQKIISSNEGRLGNDNFFVNVSFDEIPQLESYGVVDARASNTIRGSTKFWNPEFASRLTDPALSLPPHADPLLRAALSQLRSSKNKPSVLERLLLVLASTRERLLYDSSMQIVTSPEERAALLSFLGEVETNISAASGVRALKVMLPRVEIALRSPLLRADEHRERKAAVDTLQAAIDRAQEALPKATTDERAIERFVEWFELTKLWKQAAEEVEPLTNPVILCRDIVRRANTLMSRIPELFAPKRRVTHFKTAPPAPEVKQSASEKQEGEPTEQTATEAAQVDETQAEPAQVDETQAEHAEPAVEDL
jgi:hypothetical protein